MLRLFPLILVKIVFLPTDKCLFPFSQQTLMHLVCVHNIFRGEGGILSLFPYISIAIYIFRIITTYSSDEIDNCSLTIKNVLTIFTVCVTSSVR